MEKKEKKEHTEEEKKIYARVVKRREESRDKRWIGLLKVLRAFKKEMDKRGI